MAAAKLTLNQKLTPGYKSIIMWINMQNQRKLVPVLQCLHWGHKETTPHGDTKSFWKILEVSFILFVFKHPLLLFKACKHNSQPSWALTLAGSQVPKKPFQLGMSGDPMAEGQCWHHSFRTDLTDAFMVPSSSITLYLVRQQEFIHCHSKCDKLNTNPEENGSGSAQRSPMIPFFGWSQEEQGGGWNKGRTMSLSSQQCHWRQSCTVQHQHRCLGVPDRHPCLCLTPAALWAGLAWRQTHAC